MRKFNTHPRIEDDILTEIRNINKVGEVKGPSQGLIWEKSQHGCVKAFKRRILEQGLVIQELRCAWCTLLIGEQGRRSIHRDHIAPKQSYPQWTFLPKNLVLACEYCNGFAVKSRLDTVRRCDLSSLF
jgi:5-methylcytosine-specific restriction endonuclease McrA